MKVRALRGVCIGPEKHLKPDETADLDPATGKFLVSISAVEEVKDPPPAPAAEPENQAESTKPQGESTEADPKSKPAKAGKEK